MEGIVFTIGHSTHLREHFLALLNQHGITALCDVRSHPYSRISPQFNREQFKKYLSACGIAYVFLGQELGARSDNPVCYENGKIQYSRLAQTELFQQGLIRLQHGMKSYRVGLMCAEKEPLECHRSILLARCLVSHGVDVQHIHANGKIESHHDALNRLTQILNLREDDMFRSREDLIADAYRLQEKRIAYFIRGAMINT